MRQTSPALKSTYLQNLHAQYWGSSKLHNTVFLLLLPHSQIPLSEQQVLDKQMGLTLCNDCVGRDKDLLSPEFPIFLGFASCQLTLSYSLAYEQISAGLFLCCLSSLRQCTWSLSQEPGLQGPQQLSNAAPPSLRDVMGRVEASEKVYQGDHAIDSWAAKMIPLVSKLLLWDKCMVELSTILVQGLVNIFCQKH